jgi:hypothetical protein
MTQHITADDIVNWSSKPESSYLLPILIRRLIHSTTIAGEIQSIDFPSDKSTLSSGYDGVLEYRGDTPCWIPIGESVWELSTQNCVKIKANNDFEKRTQIPLGKISTETTYIGVSTRKFPDKNNWKLEKQSRGWKEVRFYDADDLSQWLELSFSTSLWFAEEIGHHLSAPGISLLERHWEGVEKMARDNIVVSPELFTNSRKENVEVLVSFLRGQPTHLAIESDSDGAALDFIAAVIALIDENDIYLSKALVLDNNADWNSISTKFSPLILITKSALSYKMLPEQLAMMDDNYLIRIAPAFKRLPQQKIIRLSRFNKNELLPQLIKSGCTDIEAIQLVNQAGGSGENLRNLISKFPLACQPEERNEALRPFVWIGGWARNNPYDKEIVKQLSKINDYEKAESLIFTESKRADTLFYVDSEIINLYSKHHGWNLFASSVSTREFEDFLSISILVISERNPKFDLPSDQQWMANLYGKTPKYSDTLKKNIAETMACLASLYDTETITFSDPALNRAKIQRKFDETVAKILHPAMTMENWASLDSILVLLAETSPKSFIRAVRNELVKGKDSVFVPLMHDEGGTTSVCKHAGLLWALEILSVSKDYHKEAVELLLSLMEIDPGGSWRNRPKNSLLEKVYCYWHLRSDVDIETRISVLDNLLNKKESTVWNVLFDIVFKSPTIVHGTSFPSWRNWGLEINEQNAEADSLVFEEKCIERILNRLGTDYARWQAMFEHLLSIMYKQNVLENFLKLLKKLEEDIPQDWTDMQRTNLVDKIREQLNRDDKYNESNKIVSENAKGYLSAFLKQIEPEDVVLQHAWLFSFGAHECFSNDELWQQEQANAVSQIISQCGFEGIKKLINIAKEPYLICKPFIKQFSDRFFIQIIPSYLESDNKNEQIFASSFISALCHGQKEEWEKKYQSDKLNPKRWKKEVAICFLSAFSEGKELWYWVDEFNESIQREFWTKQDGKYWQYDKWDDKIIPFVYKKLMYFQNYDAALTFAAPKKGKKYDIDIVLCFSLLQNIMEHFHNVRNYVAIVDIITFLQKQFIDKKLTDKEQLQLANIELFFINLLYDYSGYGYHCSPKVLVSQVMNSPEFFVKLLQYTFRPSQEEIPDHVETELPNRSQVASATYRLLDNLNQIPGETNDIIDSNYLNEWVKKSRELAKTCARLKICDTKIGQLFARCSLQTLEEQLPNIELMQILEKINSEAIFDGFYTGLINNRAVTIRGHFEGGKQELDIASIYKRLAEQASDYPNVSKIFYKLESHYIEEANEWEERSQCNKML